ncbi:hypothetical protein TSOC_010429 [Tetrabaena socialis]|uniref:Phosphatidic acid phosphatase type 2/haloperoxidase domain-containing protein n=1 Tax=Tetrabaena socialis TaxID=47790 RepID=A0A2J7ZTB0_9CHLO|nr:hypothetical protein TSOC_010429 [Tetrabaena socialis]|eukprot:PNH03509.1 hypothetical protein TSOC_010429 [Tetrabaena socialis]
MRGGATAAVALLLIGSAFAGWGPSGNVVQILVDTGPPAACLPPPAVLNLAQEYAVFDALVFNQIIALAVGVTYDWLAAAGWNYNGSLPPPYKAQPYMDYTGYTPKNSPWDLTNPCNWQPLHETDGRGKTWIQTHLLPYAPNIKPFFIDAAVEGKRTVPKWDCNNATTYKAQVDEVLAYSAALNDTTKMQAEVLGPQPFALITILMLRASKGWSITDIDLQTGPVLTTKLETDMVRPASAVRYLYGETTVTAYAGKGQGTKTMPGKDWVPYLSTFNEGEFPSGATCWCTVLNEWIQLWQGGDSNPDSNKFSPPLTFGFQPGCSMREPFASPEYIQKCKDARVIGGVHFRAAVDAGQAICSGVTQSVWGKIKKLYPKLDGKTC